MLLRIAASQGRKHLAIQNSSTDCGIRLERCNRGLLGTRTGSRHVPDLVNESLFFQLARLGWQIRGDSSNGLANEVIFPTCWTGLGKEKRVFNGSA